MKRPPFRRSPTAARAFVLALLVASLSACGPGTGGTGTGETPPDLAVFGASSVDVCTAPFAGQLVCGVPVSSADTPVAGGTQAVVYVDIARGNLVEASVRSQSVRLQARCEGIDFTGEWGVAGSSDARFFGSFTAPGSAGRVPGSLTVQVVPDTGAPHLAVVLRDLAGRAVLGPVTLRRITGPLAVPTACP